MSILRGQELLNHMESLVMRWIAILCLALAPALRCPAGDVKDISVLRIGVDDGLSQYMVNTIYQDEFDFIWIGTLDGLNRYDGSRMEIFRPSKSDTLSLRENNIRYICGDRNGHLYIKGLESVSEYDMRANTFRVILDRGVRAICWKGGRLWLAVGNEIFIYDDARRQTIQYFSFPDDDRRVSISSFLATETGDLYISTVLHGFYRVNPHGEVIRHIPMAEANSLTEDSHGNIWVASRSEGLYRIAPSGDVKHFTSRPGVPGTLLNNNVRHVCEDEGGNFFVGTYNGLCYLETATERFTEYRYEFFYAPRYNKSILTMMRDRQGTLWIGTFYDGLQRYNKRFDIYRHHRIEAEGEDSQPVSLVNAITEDSAGRLWLGTEGGGLNAYDPRSGAFTSVDTGKGLSSNVVKSLLYEPKDNVLWIATLYHGINRMDLSSGAIRRIHNPVYYNGEDIGYPQNIVRIIPYGDSLLLGTNKGAVVMDKRTLRMTRLETGFVSPRRAQIWDICSDPQDNMWLTSSTDLYCIRPGSHLVKRYPFREIAGSHANNHMKCILRDSRGRMWFGSSGSGIFLYDPASDRFRNWDSSDGLANDFITAMIEHRDGSGLYIATNSGLSFFDPDAETFVNYGYKTGFPVNAIHEGGLYMTVGGEIFASGHNGLVSIRHDSLSVAPRDYRVYITGISVNNAVVNPADESNGILHGSTLYQDRITLRARHSVISFHFTGTDFLGHLRPDLEYKLEGIDQGFIHAPDNSSATYTNLSPGRYTFIVRAEGAGNTGPGARLQVTVLPPFHKSVWFVLLCLAVTASITFFLIRSYAHGLKLRASLESEKRENKHIEEVNQSKFRFFTNISHEFRTPLTLIDAQLEMLLRRRDIKPTVYSGILNVYKNSRRMRRLVDEIIDLRRQEQGAMKLRIACTDMVEFLREVYLSFEDYAKHNDIAYDFSTAAESLPVWFDANQMEKVVYNLLSNAFKYVTPGGMVSLALKEAGEQVEITVTDNGTGISAAHISNIFDRFYQVDAANENLPTKGSGVGLALSKSIVEMHGGRIGAVSVPGEQTRFTVVLDKDPGPDATRIRVTGHDMRERYILRDASEAPSLPPDMPAAPEMAGTKEQEDKSVRILIVDDNHEMCDVLSQIFSPVYSVSVAYDGTQGIEMARELLPDIILSDVMMPGISGIEMCRRLKGDFQTCHIPIVLLTARSADEHKIEGLLTGADDYVVKPFGVELLVARCNNLVMGRKRLQQKYRKEPDAPVEMLSSNPMDSDLLRKAMAVVERNLENPNFDIRIFARDMGLSRTYLFSKIKGLVGQTPNEFITNIRLKKAAAMLMSDPASSVSDIAFRLGFNSLSYFIKCFKDMYGRSPSAYRKDHLA